MILLQAQQVARHFGADVLFENIDLDIQEHSRIALVGKNGAGKSTLLKMIIGQQAPDEGQIVTKKGLTIGYLAQNTGLESDKTIYEEMLSVFDRLRQMEQDLHRLEAKIADPNAEHASKAYQQLLNRYDQLLHDFKEQNGYGYEIAKDYDSCSGQRKRKDLNYLWDFKGAGKQRTSDSLF